MDGSMHAAATPELKVLPEGGTGLPAAHTPFVGRQGELAALVAAVLEHHLVTVTGPCGVGKSRLAAQAAADLGDTFVDGFCYLDMSQVAPTADLHGTFGHLPGLAAGRRLLLLDNVAHLITPLRAAVVALLGANPGLRVLCTSLAPLGLQSEFQFQLAPLSPNEAARLFRTCAGAAVLDSDVDDLSRVESVCQTLGGLPLAIVLAAELAPVLPLDQLAGRLRSDLTLLTTRKADVPARHRSMCAAIARNCDLLDEKARELFRRLAVFEERFTLATAEAVCPDASLPAGQVLPLLRELIHVSLVQVEQHQGTPVYALLPVTRLYARECLAAAGETRAIRARHRDWFLDLVEQVSRHKDRSRWSEVDPIYPDAEAALDTALDTGDGITAQRFCTALSGYWSGRGKVQTGYSLLQQALALSCGSPFHHTRALTTAGCMAGDLGDLTTGESLLRQAVARWRELADTVEAGRTLMNLGVVLRRQGKYDDAEAAYRESLSIQTTLPDQSDLVLTYLNLGVVLGTRGNHAQAAVQFQAALDAARRLGDQWLAATALSQLALAAVAEKRLDEAVAHQTEALILFRGLGDQLGMAVTLSALAGVSRELGHLEQALAYYRECVTIALKMRRMTTLLDNLDQLMQVLLSLKQCEVVARLLGFCDLARQRESVPRSPQLSALALTLTEESTQALGGTWFGALYRAGSLMSLEQAAEVATTAAAPLMPKAPEVVQPPPCLPIHEAVEGLSAREVQIIQLLVEGLSSRELGERLFLSPRTVEKHLERLRQRLGVPNKARLVAWALQNGFGSERK